MREYKVMRTVRCRDAQNHGTLGDLLNSIADQDGLSSFPSD